MFDFSHYYDWIAEWLPPGCRVAEIGIADGDSVIHLAKRLLQHNKTFKIYAVDNMQYGGYIQMKTIYENLIKHGVAQYVEVIPKDSLEAAKDFNDGYLDFCFIDSSHEYLQTKKEIPVWYDKVKDLGLLSGHDVFLYDTVMKAVLETVPEYITREPLPDGQIFEPEKILHFFNTSSGYGIYEIKKDWYIKLKK